MYFRRPRASGGVSALSLIVCKLLMSSPRERGCFCRSATSPYPYSVFPARAGVFLSVGYWYRTGTSLPRASGGVSSVTQIFVSPLASSPRERGCFPMKRTIFTITMVFPARAGVFLSRSPLYPRGTGLPRASGGVSAQYLNLTKLAMSSPRERGCFSLVKGIANRK